MSAAIAAATIEKYHIAALSPRSGLAPATLKREFELLILGPASSPIRLHHFKPPIRALSV